jgi:hypothetical protein
LGKIRLLSATLEKKARKVTHAGGMKLKWLPAGGKTGCCLKKMSQASLALLK